MPLDIVSSVLSIMLTVVSQILVASFAWLLRYRNDGPEKFSTLTDNLQRSRGWVSLYWNVMVLVRWSATIVILVALRNQYAF
jgi:hypothetical protein